MRVRALVHLAALNLRSDRRGTAVNAAAACVGAAALGAVSSRPAVAADLKTRQEQAKAVQASIASVFAA